ncbi:MAG: TatD family hydrolase [Pseudomonadales bacterium]|nr:TatD family hydrolase [Pseudomonadales bacterium]
MSERPAQPITLPEGAPFGALVDIGVNLTDRAFAADRREVLARAHASGVVHQLVTGTDVAHSRLAAELAGAHPRRLAATAGVHPHHAKDVRGDWLAELRELLARPEVRAVGETGLDFNRDFSPRPVQERVFEAQLELAVDTGQPLFLHERDSAGRFFELLAPFVGRIGGVLHCFTGSEQDLERALDAGLHIGITGWICDERRGGELQRLAPRIPDERLLIETDAPYLLPRTIRPRRRSRRNEPALLPWVVATLASCRGQSPAHLARITTANARALFALGD